MQIYILSFTIYRLTEKSFWKSIINEIPICKNIDAKTFTTTFFFFVCQKIRNSVNAFQYGGRNCDTIRPWNIS